MEGIERIKILASEIKDEALLKIIDYLVSREDMNEKYLNEEKTLSDMVNYINRTAKSKSTGTIAMFNDDEVFGWAIHYFDESNEDLKVTPVAKNATKISVSSKTKIPKEKKEVKPEGQLSLFDF